MIVKLIRNLQTKKGIAGDVPLMMSATTVGKIYGFTDIMSVYNRHNMGMSMQNDFYLVILRQNMAIVEIIGGNIRRLWKQVKMKVVVKRAFLELHTKGNIALATDIVRIMCGKYPFHFT